jgi:hypothetical protein
MESATYSVETIKETALILEQRVGDTLSFYVRAQYTFENTAHRMTRLKSHHG